VPTVQAVGITIVGLNKKSSPQIFPLDMKFGATHETEMVEPLSIDLSAEEGGVVLTVKGRVNIDSSPELRDRLLALLQKEFHAALTIDLTGVPYIDSSGLATLVEALKLARAVKTRLRLRLQERPLYLLQVTGLLPLFDAAPGPSSSRISQGDS
jgi:anti-sigma B factor antagonist